uniref:Uncharacterized protein n=1 Tax=Anopheles atroparvus TaxID=41427 RepID=A0A182JG87_ANOAO
MAPHTQTAAGGGITIKQPFQPHHQWPWAATNPPSTVTAFTTVAQSPSAAGGSTLPVTTGAALLRAATGSSSAAAVSPSNKLKRQQPNASSVGTGAAAATAPATTGVQMDGTGKSNSNSSNNTSGGSGNVVCNPSVNMAAKRARPNTEGARIVCKSVGTNTTTNGGGPPALVAQQQAAVTNLPKLVRSSSTTTAGLTALGRSNGSTQTQTAVVSASSPPALNPLTLDCGSSNDSGIVANSSDSEDKSLTIDLCSPGSPDDSSSGGKKDDEEASSSSTSGAGSSKGSDSRTTPSQSPPLSAADEEDDCDDHQMITTTTAPSLVTSTVAAVSPFPPPLRLLSDVAVAAAEVEAAIIHQRRHQTSVTLAIPSITAASSAPSQQHSPKSTVLELIRQKHLQQLHKREQQEHSSMELDEDETCSSAKGKEENAPPRRTMAQSSLDEQQPQESSMSTASSAAEVSDLQEDDTSTSTRSPLDGQEQQQKEEKQTAPSMGAAVSHLSPPSIETDLLGPLAPGATCARSPILSQPKTIRFPAPNGTAPHHNFGRKGFRRSGDGRLYGACYWRDCDNKFDSSSQLLDHLQIAHVNTQKGPYACLWDGCKVHNKECTKFNWLEKHVLSHACSKPHKCIVAGCGMRFASQSTLLKHVNSHFANADNASSSKRSSDPPVPKLHRKTGKKLRYRRQPWSARRFDFFDAGIMEGLQHRLIRIGAIASGTRGTINFRGKLIARRQVPGSEPEMLVRWWPTDVLPEEWIPESSAKASPKLEKQSVSSSASSSSSSSVTGGTGFSSIFSTSRTTSGGSSSSASGSSCGGNSQDGCGVMLLSSSSSSSSSSASSSSVSASSSTPSSVPVPPIVRSFPTPASTCLTKASS